MIFHTLVFLITLLFFGGFEGVLIFPDRSIEISVIVIVLLWRFSWKLGGSPSSAALPTLFAVSTALLLFFVSASVQQQALLVLASSVFYAGSLGIYRLRQYTGDTTARSMLSLTAMAALFFFYSAFYGIFLNFRAFTQLMLMVSFGSVTFLTAYHSLRPYFPDNYRRTRLYALLLGFLTMEIAWVAGFWPFGYLTTGVLVLILFSLPFDILQYSSSGTLSKRRAFSLFMVTILLLSMVLASSAWLPRV